jgi:urease accessory protein
LLAKKIFLGPMSFIIGMLAELFIIISGYNLFLVEFIIAISLLLIWVFIISGKKVNFSFISSSLLVVELFHGWAFWETIVGQENVSSYVLSGYQLGLSVIVWALSVASSIIYKNIYKVFDLNDIKIKVSGGVISGVGTFLLLENIENRIISLII